MDAVCLIDATRRALLKSAEAADIVTEAWQAQAIARDVGGRLAETGPPLVRPEAEGLREAGSRACRALQPIGHPSLRGEEIRTAELSGIADPHGALRELGDLLGRTGTALFGAAVAAEGDGLYWTCVEAIDAADESGDRVGGILRRLETAERGGLGRVRG